MREARIERSTKETSIDLTLSLDAAGPWEIECAIPFLGHMLHAMAFHGGFGLRVKATGDLEVDPHHLVEDIGIVLGQALGAALGKEPIQRYGHAVIPMDDSLGVVTIDLCKRPYLVHRVSYPQDRSGTFDMWLLREFFQGLANAAAMNLHLEVPYGHNSHHMAEALFKALGKALWQASRPQALDRGVASTKGTL